MSSFGQRLAQRRKERNLTQAELARRLETDHSLIGKYERDQVRPSIDVIPRMAAVLDTTVSFLLGEGDEALFKESAMLKRLKELRELPEEERRHIIYALDAMLRDARAKSVFA